MTTTYKFRIYPKKAEADTDADSRDSFKERKNLAYSRKFV